MTAAGKATLDPRPRYHMRVAWIDTDASGRIHHTAAFRWAEAAEHALMRDAGLTVVDGFPRRHVEATFHRPLRFPDAFDLIFGVERIGRSSITYAWQAVRGGELCAEGRSIVVHVDEGGRPAPVPPELRAVLEQLVASDA